jgi:p-hydroxybenzoate 3-monooxygenase
VAIIGAGPAGLLLSELLYRGGVSSIVLEKYSRSHVLSRIRAGVLEQTAVDVFRANGLSERMDREGQPHDGVNIVWAGRDGFFIDMARHVGKRFLTYGQTKSRRICSRLPTGGTPRCSPRSTRLYWSM